MWGMISNDIHHGAVVSGTSGIRWCGPCSSLLPSSHIPSNTWYPFWSLEIIETVRHETENQTNFVRKIKRKKVTTSPWKFKIDSQNRYISLKGDTFSIFIYICIYIYVYIYTLYTLNFQAVSSRRCCWILHVVFVMQKPTSRGIRSLPKTFQNCSKMELCCILYITLGIFWTLRMEGWMNLYGRGV